MSDRQQIAEMVEYFYNEIIEKYKDLERQIASESRILTIFKKVDYKERITRLKNLQKMLHKINPNQIKAGADDEVSLEVKDKLEVCLSAFRTMVDTQIAFNTILHQKSEGKKEDVITYKKAVYNVKKETDSMQHALRALDAVYANLEEDE